MVLFNYSTKELTAKIVYYGPGLCGKTTNLQFIHENLSQIVKGKMLSLATKTDRTLFFDFLPMDLGEIRGMKTRMQLYTVPGQVFYNETRKLVLKGVDGIVFVADSQKEMLNPNIESFKNLEENLKAHGLDLETMPHVIQFNKSDLPKLSTVEEINSAINKYNAPFYESVATTGIGVQDTLKAITKLVLLNLTKKYEPRTAGTKAVKKKATTVKATTVKAAIATPAIATPAVGLPVSEAPTIPGMPAMAAGSKDSPGPSALEPKTPAVDSPPPPAPTLQAAVPVAASTVSQLPSATPPAMDGTAFGDDDIVEDLLSEVQVATVDAPDGSTNPTEEESTDWLGDKVPSMDEAESFGDSLVKLTQVVNDHELFDDPDLQVAQLDAGQCHEIVVPVQIGREGTTVRKFKLTLKLQLDPID